MKHSFKLNPIALALGSLAACYALAAGAADVTVTAPAGGGFAVQDSSSVTRLRVDGTGSV